MKILDRIRDSKPTINLEHFEDWQRQIKNRRKIVRGGGQHERSRHGYIAREPSHEVKIPVLPSVSQIMDHSRSTSGHSLQAPTFHSRKRSTQSNFGFADKIDEDSGDNNSNGSSAPSKGVKKMNKTGLNFPSAAAVTPVSQITEMPKLKIK